MKKVGLLLVCLWLALGALSAQDRAVATVRLEKTEPISSNQLNDAINALEKQYGRTLSPEERKEVLDTMTDQVLVVQAAIAEPAVNVEDAEVEEAGKRRISQLLQSIGAIPPGALLTDSDQYQEVVEQQNIPFEYYVKTVRNQLLVEKYVAFKERLLFEEIKEATAEEINNEYQKRVSEFVISDSVWFNHIFFNTLNLSPEEAEKKKIKSQDVYRKLRNSSLTFTELLIAESEDEESKSRGGLVGPIMKGNTNMQNIYGEEFIDKVFGLNDDQFSPPLQSKVGYHIIEITKKEEAGLLPKEDPEIQAYLKQLIYADRYQTALQKALEKIVLDLRGRATINYFGEYR